MGRRGALEIMGLDKNFWAGKKVFITGHTGFKGSWLSFWLNEMGAEVKGYALKPATTPNLFEILSLEKKMDSVFGDIRDYGHLQNEISEFEPDIVFHMAAQAIVRESYDEPVETFQTNVIGTANLLEAIRTVNSVQAVISVTSDKCYENHEWNWKYRESDSMGGWDPYSASKGCAELVTASYRRSFFLDRDNKLPKIGIASVRAGNIVGGGDWSKDRLIPDIMRSFSEHKAVVIRNPAAIRPWQYILDLLHGYMILTQKLYKHPAEYSEAWNFGPPERDEQSVEYIVDHMIRSWGDGASWKQDEGFNPHEAGYLKLDSSKSRMRLGWSTGIGLPKALGYLTKWYKNYYDEAEMADVSRKQISEFEELISQSENPE